MKVVFMGTPDFAVPCLSALIEKHEVAAVFTQPDKPIGRKQVLTPPPVKKRAQKNNIAVYQPAGLKDGMALEFISHLAPDVIVVAAYGKILPKPILELPKYGCINIHASLLPKYRGAAPIQWAIINGEHETGLTAMQMDEGLDTGDMIQKISLPIDQNETADDLCVRLSALGADLILQTLASVENGSAKRAKQEESLATYAPMLSKEMSQLDFNCTAMEVHDKVRGLNSWPSATANLDGQKVKIHSTRLADGEGRPGEILSLKPFVVSCKTGAVEIVSLQPAGKKIMSAQDYLCGHRLAVHTLLVQ